MPSSDNSLLGRHSPRVKQLRGAFAGQARISGGLVALEGEHLVEEALRSGLALKSVFLSDRRETPSFLPPGLEVLRLDAELFASLGETRSPQGIAALIVPPVWTLDQLLTGVPLVLVAAGLQDPGNLGTLIRSAEAFGASGLLTTAGTVSPWNGKAIRASAGSVFRLPTLSATTADLETLRRRGLFTVAAVGGRSPGHDTQEAATVDLTRATALFIGNEGAGLPPDLLALADARVTVPCVGAVESLNAAVAGSVLLYEAQAQRSRVGRQDRPPSQPAAGHETVPA